MTLQEIDGGTPKFDDLIGGIYDEPPQHSEVLLDTFEPWHHPRKQYLRINQLCSHSQKLVKNAQVRGGCLNYLTLPGEEFLDVQALEGIFDRVNSSLKLKYIGFNKSSQHDERQAILDVTESTIKDSSLIDSESQTLSNDIRDIANTQSLAFKTVAESAPYEIINLDLCGSIASSESGSGSHTYFDALSEILSLQKKHMAGEFLLFITTRTELNDIEPVSLQNIVGVYGRNLDDSEEFRAIAESMFEDEAHALIAKLSSAEEVDQGSLNNIFGVGLGKWLIHIMKPRAPHWDVTLESFYSYGVGGMKSNMLSVAFKFTKVYEGIFDDSGLSTIGVDGLAQSKSETELAIQMLVSSGHKVDLDEYLATDIPAMEKATNQTAVNLTKLGFNSEKYRAWVAAL